MKNYFTVILHDVNGSRQFRFHKRVKYAAAMITAATVTAAVTAFITLSELREEVASLKSAKVALQAEKAKLERQSQALLQGIDEAKTQMDAIEIAMGLKEAENTPLPFRVQRARTDAEARARVLELIPNGSPVPYKGISSKFGYRTHPITHQREMHKGTDLRAAMDTPIYATADGVVEFAGSRNTKGYGRLIILDHAYGFRTYYGHLHKIEVTNGQVLKKGDLIGYSGNSGTSNGPHLHYEVRFIQRPLNPYWFIKWEMGNYDAIFAKIKKVSWEPILQAIADEAETPKVLMTKASL